MKLTVREVSALLKGEQGKDTCGSPHATGRLTNKTHPAPHPPQDGVAEVEARPPPRVLSPSEGYRMRHPEPEVLKVAEYEPIDPDHVQFQEYQCLRRTIKRVQEGFETLVDDVFPPMQRPPARPQQRRHSSGEGIPFFLFVYGTNHSLPTFAAVFSTFQPWLFFAGLLYFFFGLKEVSSSQPGSQWERIAISNTHSTLYDINYITLPPFF